MGLGVRGGVRGGLREHSRGWTRLAAEASLAEGGTALLLGEGQPDGRPASVTRSVLEGCLQWCDSRLISR